MSDLSPLVHLKIHEDSRGRLVSIEGAADVSFEIARIYYILPGDGAPRGFHAHRQLQQLMICVAGSCRLMLDNGTERCDFVLDQPDVGAFIDPLVWHEMHELSSDAILLVLASARYDEGDYIRDYDEFVRLASTSKDGS